MSTSALRRGPQTILSITTASTLVVCFVIFTAWFFRTAPQQLAGFVGLSIGAVAIVALGSVIPAARAPLTAAFGIRALLTLVHQFVFSLPATGADTRVFIGMSAAWSQQSFGTVLDQFQTGSWLYPWLLSLAFRMTGSSELLAQSINAMLGSLTVLVVYRIALQLWGAVPAVRAAWIAAVFPTLALYSAVALRETPVVLCFALGLDQLLLWIRGRGIGHFFGSIAFIVVAAMFHGGMIVALLGVALVVTLRIGNASPRRRSTAALTGLVGVAVAFGLFSFLTGTGQVDKIGPIAQLEVADIGNAQATAARSRASYLDDVVVRSPVDMVVHAPLRVAYFLFAPFPWMFSAVADTVGVLDGLMYLATMFALWRARHSLGRSFGARSVLIVAAVVAYTFAMGTSNYGTAIRHRAKVMPVILAVAVAPVARREKSELSRG